ncbi:PTS sugar transporter subunit IIA [[Enterobacter] lignolyticus]|uniref:PTS system fructose subfamily IIA component n=1 Tax=Enterobacter lignolyticus (strain SCF1) TaxID=701347 RepID=E3G1I7_ENTLS|nr:PTS fructose subfamily transporter subunit IIA [[Enterobacter] lignolyticus]ADO50272.1 PTS system fructose subfamily IIA component [[Enterobacter] lignolyticus SCF1]
MTQLVLLSHGDIAVAIRDAAFDILGPRNNVHALALRVGDSPQSLALTLHTLLSPSADEPAVLMCDIAGGTPANVALKYGLQHPQTTVFAGLNLSMVLACMQDNSSYLSATDLLQAAHDGIIDISAKARNLTNRGQA